MLKATIIYQQKGTVCYNVYGEEFFIDQFYELETPFYACYAEWSDERNIMGAFQKKEDLLEWMYTPLRKNVNGKKQLVEDIARENMERFAGV